MKLAGLDRALLARAGLARAGLARAGLNLFGVGTALSLLLACSSGSGSKPNMAGGALDPDPARSAEPGAPTGEQPGDSPASDMTDGPAPETLGPEVLVDTVPPPEPNDVVDVVCVAQSAASELRRVYMAFALDISASMGAANQANGRHFEEKWLPVVAATKSFFAEPEAAGLSAQMTFFPRPGVNNQTQCTGSYATPSVPQTRLPSPVFGDAIDALGMTPNPSSWPGTTPTLAMYEGVVESVRALQQGVVEANATFVIVMVTDGLPQNCGNNAVQFQSVLTAIQGSGIPTFVIGVELEQDSVNLNQLAMAGGTDSAFLIGVGDPTQTERDFKAAIDQIRGVSVSCQVEIPLPPANTTFIPEQVNVTYKSSGALVRMAYDPECQAPDAWHYDDPSNPAVILLCDATCGTLKADVQAELEIEFGCKRQDVPR